MFEFAAWIFRSASETTQNLWNAVFWTCVHFQHIIGVFFVGSLLFQWYNAVHFRLGRLSHLVDIHLGYQEPNGPNGWISRHQIDPSSPRNSPSAGCPGNFDLETAATKVVQLRTKLWIKYTWTKGKYACYTWYRDL